MLAVAIATTTLRALSYGTIYHTKLLRRGRDIDRAGQAVAGLHGELFGISPGGDYGGCGLVARSPLEGRDRSRGGGRWLMPVRETRAAGQGEIEHCTRCRWLARAHGWLRSSLEPSRVTSAR